MNVSVNMHYFRTLKAAFSIALFMPAAAYAAPNTLGGIIELIIDIIQTAIPVVGALILLLFFWQMAMLIYYADSSEELRKRRGNILWGVLALFLLGAVWGVVTILEVTFLSGSGGESIRSFLQ